MTIAERLRAIAGALPDGASVTLPAADIRAWLAEEPARALSPLVVAPEPQTWRERLWTCGADVRLGVREVSEALDRSPDWVYRAVDSRRSAERGRAPLPCSKLDGVLVFTAGAVRRWVQASERVVHPEPRHMRVAR